MEEPSKYDALLLAAWEASFGIDALSETFMTAQQRELVDGLIVSIRVLTEDLVNGKPSRTSAGEN